MSSLVFNKYYNNFGDNYYNSLYFISRGVRPKVIIGIFHIILKNKKLFSIFFFLTIFFFFGLKDQLVS